MRAPHQAVKHELLVRCLDAWLPSALRGGRSAAFVARCGAPLVAEAMRVFGEFADLLGRHPLRVILLDAAVATAPPPGLLVEQAPAPPADLAGPTFGFLDGGSEADFARVTLGAQSSALIFAPAVAAVFASSRIDGTGPYACRADLVATDGHTESMVFATDSEKSLEKFKDELWALDEYAGIKLRDPADPSGTLLEITVEPHLAPLRRELLAHLSHDGPRTVADLRGYTLRSTIFRASDANRAVTALVHSGACVREPPAGRLTAETVVAVRSEEIPPVP